MSRRLRGFGRGSEIQTSGMVRGHRHIVLGERVHVWNDVRLHALDPVGDAITISIGDDSSVHARTHISAVRDVTIGRNVLIAPNCYVTDHDHYWLDPADPPRSSSRLVHAPTFIDDHVWLGEKVSVLKGVTIGRNSIIGANSVVTRDIPPYSIAVGSPARVVRTWSRELKAWVRC